MNGLLVMAKEIESKIIANILNNLQYGEDDKYFDNEYNHAILDAVKSVIDTKLGGPFDPLDYFYCMVSDVTTKEDFESTVSELRKYYNSYNDNKN